MVAGRRRRGSRHVLRCAVRRAARRRAAVRAALAARALGRGARCHLVHDPAARKWSRTRTGSDIVVGDEDCLHLDVTLPRGSHGSPPGGARPVVVWVHGGNFVDGAAGDYGPARLAAEGDLVVVTVNYRVGALGFLSSPALDALGQPSGNYGLEDQAAALRWVERNIAAFGGDPHNVTLAGQSAGSRAVCAHLAAPASEGLFDKVILQSGGCANEAKSKDLADAHGLQVAAEVGVRRRGRRRWVPAGRPGRGDRADVGRGRLRPHRPGRQRPVGPGGGYPDRAGAARGRRRRRRHGAACRC